MSKRKTYPYDPDYVVHPGRTLEECIVESGLPRKAVHRMLGVSEDELNAVIEGEAPVTPEMAKRLGTIPFASERLWLALQANYDAGLAVGKKIS